MRSHGLCHGRRRGQKWTQRRRQHPNSTEGPPNGQSRLKAVFKVYAAGLYPPKKAAATEEVLNMTGPKRIAITMLRDIDSKELGKLFSRGMEDNMEKGSFAKLIPGVIRMSKVFSDHKTRKEGESFVIDCVPGTGMVMTVKGVAEAEPFKEPEFFNALMRIWLGPNPADWKLKEALLGKS
ncbi:MAG: chalcone isomerase family protein [Hydrogenophaga sp.]